MRRKTALAREAEEERLRAALEASAGYLTWLEQSEREAKENEEKEKEEHDERERLWLEEEVRAQKEWQILQEKKQKARQIQLEQEMKIRQEFEAKQETIRKKQEEEKRKREEDIKKREQLLKDIDDYIDNGIKTPEPLREVIDSQPGKELCPFFTKTAACRYGDTCSRNHRRVCLSKVILVPGFYTHFALEKNSAEYDTDVALEFESSEMRQHFREFYNDVVPELESFGRIKTLKYCCNTEVHLRGNLYVEYYTEREAARAVRALKGRWYAGRQLNCEFANLKSWRSAVCGMIKCPKGKACNFLHTFKNPHDEYDVKSPPRWTKQTSGQEASSSRRSEHRSKSKWEEPINSDAEENKHWRWSESPEVDLEHRSKNSENSRHRSTGRSYYRNLTHSKKQLKKVRTSENERSVRRHRSSSKKYTEEKAKDYNKDNTINGQESTRSHSARSRRLKGNELNYDDSNHTQKSYPDDNHGKTYHSKSQRHIKKHSRKRASDYEDVRRGSHNRGEVEDDSIRKRRRKDAKKSRTKGATATSKLEKEESEESSSESTKSSTSSTDSEVERPAATNNKRKISTEKFDNDWATTDSESDNASKNIAN